jgi:hypothetical protein
MSSRNVPLDLEALLHPAQAFEHPMKVINDPDLTLSEKRAILASWASDACAVEATPALRRRPEAAPCSSTTSWTHCACSIGRPATTSRARTIGACWSGAFLACSAAGRECAPRTTRGRRSIERDWLLAYPRRSSGAARISAQNTLYLDFGA